MLKNFNPKSLILFLAILFISACFASKEITKSKEFLDAGMFDQAIILLRQEIQTNPKNAEAHMLLGTAYLGSGSSSLAEPELNTAIVMDNSLKSEASKRCYDIGKILAKTDKSRANAALIKAKEYDPAIEKDEQFFFLANIDTELSDTAQMDAAKKYLTLFPSGANTAQATYILAERLMSSDKTQAKTYFTQLISQFPGSEWARKSGDHLANWTETKTITVDAKTMWTDTGITLIDPSDITVQASGSWANGNNPPEYYSANGIGHLHPGTTIQSASLGALIGKIGGNTFVVGENYSGRTPASGKLYLGMNDLPTADAYTDNLGQLTVQITYKAR